MDGSNKLPRLPEDRIEQPLRELADVLPGEQIILDAAFDLNVDEAGRVWVNASSKVQKYPLLPGKTLRAERVHNGFILWLDKRVKFRPKELLKHERYLPVVEFRQLSEEEEF